MRRKLKRKNEEGHENEGKERERKNRNTMDSKNDSKRDPTVNERKKRRILKGSMGIPPREFYGNP